ncbi:hypothetical protein GQR58_030059 [Nymphon striatum]|nr:hypothetical protein GQR58_030059 [Nymphon striatum]
MNRLHLPPKGMINDSFRSNFPWHFNAWGQFDPACLCVVEQHAIVVTRCEMAADFPRNPSDRGTGWLYGCCYFAVAWIADMALGRRLDWFRRIFKHARGALFLGGNLHNVRAMGTLSRGLCRIKLNPLVHFFRQAQAVGNRKASYYIRQIFGLSGQCLAGRGCFFEHAGVLLCRDIQLFYRRVDFTDPSRLVVGRGRNQGHVLRLRRVCHRGSCQADAGFINQRDALINAAPIASHQPILGWQAPSFHSWQKAPYYRAPRRPASQPQNRSGCDGQGSLLTYLVYLFIQKAAYCAFVFRLGVITADDEFKIDIPSILEAIELMRMTFGGVNNTLEQLLKLVRRSEKRAKKAPKFAKAA